MNIPYEMLLPALAAFLVSAGLSPFVIPFLKRLKFGQYVREEGPKEHYKKLGTPTMGGLIILASVVIVSGFYVRKYPELWPVLLVTVGFGMIGFLDDFIKVVRKRSMGLSAWQKLILQLVIAVLFAWYLCRTKTGEVMLIPFSGGLYIDLGSFTGIAMVFIMLGTVNGANFTDGLDGLASSVTILIATFLTVVSIGLDSSLEPMTCAVVGALLGFLVYNVYPARVFMGDTGSLALGGFVAATAIMLKLPLFIPLVAFVYVIEVLSVIIQVIGYKLTGKRVFRMAPLHHHFELGGWPETKVVAIFSIVTAILCLMGLMGMGTE